MLPLQYMRAARDLCDRHGLALHLDGARVCNAAVALGVEPAEITSQFDSVAICLSKGLGAPAGTFLVGSREFVAQARRWRKVVGGGMRQVGFIAAAGIHALDNHVERLETDHANARRLADGLARIDGIDVDHNAVQTNMVFAKLATDRLEALRRALRATPGARHDPESESHGHPPRHRHRRDRRGTIDVMSEFFHV